MVTMSKISRGTSMGRREEDKVVYLDNVVEIVPYIGRRDGPALHPLANRLLSKKPFRNRIFSCLRSSDSWWVPSRVVIEFNNSKTMTLNCRSRTHLAKVLNTIVLLKEHSKGRHVLVQDIFRRAETYEITTDSLRWVYDPK